MNTLINKTTQSESVGIYIFAFLIPLNPKWYGFGIAILLIEAIVRRNFASRQDLRQFFNFKKAYIWLLLFYGFHFTGMFYSTNSSFGWMDIGMKASFAIFPLYFLVFKHTVSGIRFMQSFVLGALVTIVICYIMSAINYYETGNSWHFRESYLSHFMHRSYWATYLTIAMVFTAYLAIKKLLNVSLSFILLIIFFTVIFVGGSKAGILIALFCVLALLFYWAKSSGKLRAAFLLASGVVGILVVAGLFVPAVTQRLLTTVEYVSGVKEVDPTSTESTTARILMWETAAELIREQPLMGVGTGDVKDALIARNIAKGYTGVAEKQMNAHNQFLNSWLALGVLGGLSLLALFILPFVFVREEVFIFRLLLVILFFSLIPESFLETQAGIIPTAFLLGFISLPKGKES
jgi:O-antigen ligase